MKKLLFTKKERKETAQQKNQEWHFEEDAQGKWKVKTFPNGTSIRLLREPSKEYGKKITSRKEAGKASAEKWQAEQEREKLIKDKIRELAIRQLEKEGKI